MSDKKIITIGREFGSGGREIGIELSKKLNIPFYDKEILAEAAKKSGFSQEVFERHDEKPTSSFLYSLAVGVNNFTHSYQKPLTLEIYLAQFDTIKKLASECSGIFIGRCSDYILNDEPDALHVFVRSDMEKKVERVMERYSVEADIAEEMCKRHDKDRSLYYNYYANVKWGDSRHYDLCLNSGKLGIQKSVDLIIDCL